MEEEINHLRTLAEEFEAGLLRISKSPETGDSVDAIKRDLIRIEGSIDYSTDKLFSFIRKDDRIPTDKRQEHLENTLNQLGINLDQFRIRRRSTVNAANEAILKMNAESMKQKRDRLLADNSANDEIINTVLKKNQNTAALASDITSHLERTREIIQEQIMASEHSILLMEESTEELQGINSAALRAEIAQSKAKMSLIKLRIAQNWDRYLLNASLVIFALSVAFVVYRRLTNNLVVTIITKLTVYFYRFLIFMKNLLSKISINIPIEAKTVEAMNASPTPAPSEVPL
ncbi:hypothetical protein TRFO_03374 [Tritrichomonas foetus]|uniref:Sec20 C-terminal domain-containing protein n=1 Tax=Tritrichomonas foetus TaxID=1144522 RepID=A0A1J4KR74_9EUKA|nr:hypothetical protein TRFO_03374 [Tritrichomonas foetus]|eukprot:OHT13602.1 hypothetical protein TRFO_03374 [Tritrichomonas foetus]